MKPVYTRAGVVAVCIAAIFLGYLLGLASRGLQITTDVSWYQLSALALGSAFAVKVIDIIYQEIRRRLDRTHAETAFVDEHLDPILKAADEVVGKLHSLATEDFKSLAGKQLGLSPIADNDFGGLLYLFGRFWARIEIFKIESLSVAIAKDERGAMIQSFLACLESTRVRIVDRTAQRAIGELFINPASETGKTIGYVEFVRLTEANEETRRWVEPLASILRRTHHTEDRQRLLQYGAIVHALIDSLDPTHFVTSNRPSYPNKLTQKTRRALRYRVFGVYLKFVRNSSKYSHIKRAGRSKKRLGGPK